MLDEALKYILPLLLGLVVYIWSRHEKNDEKKYKDLEKKITKFEDKIKDETIRDNNELREKMREGKTEIISAIKELSVDIDKISENLTEYKLETTAKITRLETIRKI